MHFVFIGRAKCLEQLDAGAKKAALASPAMDHLVQNWPVTPAQIVQTFLDTATSSAAEASSGQFCGFRQSEVVSNANLNAIDYVLKRRLWLRAKSFLFHTRSHRNFLWFSARVAITEKTQSELTPKKWTRSQAAS